MHKFTTVFFVAILVHTLKSGLVFAPVSGTSIDIDKDGKFADRITINHFQSDMEGYKAYTYQKEGDKYVNITKVFFGERLLKVGGYNMKCDYVFYIKVFWKNELAPFLIKLKYYSWSWAPYRKHFKLNPQLEWEEVFIPTIDETSETGYRRLFKQRMDNLVSSIGDELLATYKPFKATKAEQTVAVATEEEKSDKKKYVLMVVVVVVFVAVASLVVFLVKFCLK
uniref:23 kDa piroplasm surface protein n=2 Tax=unclassified Theileria TaxID=203686 RepID=B2LUF8_9APIC|nr:23 kDa piroplasm surface protein [Theileria sp. ex Hongan buffalo]ACB87597.1 23 kDa piroplasm surface protein [Theileria sp. ex Xiantao cow]